MALDQQFTEFVGRGLAAQDAANLALANATVGALNRADAAELDQAADIDRLRGELAAQIDTAHRAVRQASGALAELASPHVYDVDVETEAGGDIDALLTNARRDLAATAALTASTLPAASTQPE